MKLPLNEEMILSENKTYMIAAYIFFILGLFGLPVLGPIIGVAIAYAKRNDVVGTYYYPHLNWLIRTFWVSFIVGIIGFITTFIFIGWLVLLLNFCWVTFRVVYGFVQLLNKQPVNDQSYFM